jgi:hypothetical protein
VRVHTEFLIPGMQHAEETDLCTKVSRIARHFEKCFRTGAEQQIVDDLLVQEAFLTLQKIRTGGKQTVAVQHVQVSEGGPAVIAGNMARPGNGKRSE